MGIEINMNDIIKWLLSLTPLVMTVFQISKININPWSSIFNFIGKYLTKDMCDKLDTVENKVDKNNLAIINMNIKEKRYEIRHFAEECRSNIKHFRCDFDRIIEVHEEYDELLDMIDDTNGVIDEEFNFIKDIYKRRLRDNDFL